MSKEDILIPKERESTYYEDSLASRSLSIKCPLCENGLLEEASIRRFGSMVTLIGYIIICPSVIGVILGSAIILLVLFGASVELGIGGISNLNPENAFWAIYLKLIGGVIIATSLVYGIIGWLILDKRSVYKCINCGHFLDRN